MNNRKIKIEDDNLYVFGKEYPLTLNNLIAVKNYEKHSDKERLLFHLSEVVLDI